MKKIFVSWIILTLGAIQLPAVSNDLQIDTWSALEQGVKQGNPGLMLKPSVNIIAPADAGPIDNPHGNNVTSFAFGPGYVTQYIQGDGVNYVFTNEGTLDIGGNGSQYNSINSYDITIAGNTPTVAAIQNSGQLCLQWVTVNGGILQTSSSASLGIYDTANAILTGNTNNISLGTIKFFTPAGMPSGGNILNIAGGNLAASVDVQLTAGNTLEVSGSGNVTIDSLDTYDGLINVSGGQLNLDAVSFLPTASSAQFTQRGGKTILNNGTNVSLTTSNGNSITAGNLTITGGSTLSIANGLSTTTTVTNAAVILMMESSLSDLYIQSNSSGVPSTLTLNSGSSINSGNTLYIGAADGSNYGNNLNVSTGATIAPGATVNIYQGNNPNDWAAGGNNLNITGGTATVDSSGTWTGNINLTSGNLTLDNVTHNTTTGAPNYLTSGYYTQTGGILNLTNGSNLTLTYFNSYNPIQTDGSGSGTSTVNIGATSGTDTSSFTFGQLITLAPTATGDNLIVNIGNGSTGNSLNITGGTLDSAVTVELNAGNTLNISGGTVTLNQAGTTGNDILNGTTNMSGGTLNADSITTYGTFNYSGGSVVVGSDTATRLLNDVHLTGVHNLTGGDIELRKSGKLTLDSADTWTGTNITNAGGSFTLDGFSHNSATAGTYSQTSGTTTLQNSSTLTTNLDTADNALSAGSVVINDSTLNLSTTAGATVGASLSGNSAGVINKNGTGTLLLTGSNSGYNGTLNVNAGEVDFNAASGTRDSYISGTTNLGSGSTLKLNTNGSYVTSSSNNISGTGTVNKTGAGEYSLNAGSNGTFDYTLNVNQGTMAIATDSSTTANFNAPVSVNSSILRLSSGGTSFNEGLTLDHGYMSILNGGFSATSPGGGLPALTVGSTVNTMNGVVASNTITGDLNVGASGVADFLIDVSPSAGTSDKYVISGDITTTNPTGTINIPDFKIVGAPTLVQNVTLNIFDQTAGGGTIESGVSFDATSRTIKTHHSLYTLSSLGGGSYMLNRTGFNPQAFRGQVATEAAYANQLTTNNILFDHIGLVSQQLLAQDKPNVYANENPLYAPYQYNRKDGSLWYKGFGNIERLQLSQGINTQNNMWGSLVGADFPVIKLKHGWECLPTAYVGYTGGYQTYDSVNMYQNGGQAGIMGTFFKGNFITSILANAGGYYNDMSVEGNRDSTGNWFAGLATKSAYNIKLPKDFILQPNMLVSYNAFGQQNWNSDFGGVAMSSGMLNGLNFGPGVNLILSKETWSVYATTQLMVNAMNGVTGTMDNIDLPSVKMGSTYIQYGVGATKRIKDRLSMYGQVMFSNGVRTGVGFQGGLQWKL